MIKSEPIAELPDVLQSGANDHQTLGCNREFFRNSSSRRRMRGPRILFTPYAHDVLPEIDPRPPQLDSKCVNEHMPLS